MINLREQAESDLAITLEGDFALPVRLTDPDGTITNVVGQVLFDYIEENPETGGPMVVHNPVVVLRKSSLSRVPVSGEKWHVKIPTSPSTTATLEDYIIDSDRPIEGGTSIGFIKLFLRKLEQS